MDTRLILIFNFLNSYSYDILKVVLQKSKGKNDIENFVRLPPLPRTPPNKKKKRTLNQHTE
jgi:hypothetical protein